MNDLLLRKLETFGPLSEDDTLVIRKLESQSRSIAARQIIIDEDERPRSVRLIAEGLACRHKILADGSRQITAYLIPGDFCDLHVADLDRMDHSIVALANSRVVELSPERIDEIMSRPALARAMRLCTLVDEATLREWVVNLGRRDAVMRMAHLFCELYARMAAVGLAQKGNFQLPLTQTDLADTVGLSTVHVNRSLQALRGLGLIEFQRREVSIPRYDRLAEFGGFDPKYLHLRDLQKTQ